MTGPGPGPQWCSGHARLSEELRGVAELLGRLQPWLQRIAQHGDPGRPGEPGGAPCTWCPVCALITALRGNQPEALARLAEHGVGLITAARELLTPAAESAESAESAPSASSAGEPAPEPGHTPPGRRVQHIVVRPAAGDPGGAAGC